MKPFFSVVIPTYNREQRILKTIQSVVEQDFTDWELIVVDDGSTDNTEEVIKTLGNKLIRYFYKVNGERGAARNFGAKQAAGEYIFFLDSDDQIKPGYLKYAHRLIEESGTKCLHIPYNLLVGDVEKNGPRLRGDIVKLEQKQNRFACQVIVHWSCMDEFQFSENRDFKIGEDWYFMLLLLSKYKFEIGKKRLGLIVQHEGRSMVEAPYQVVLDSLDIFIRELRANLSHPEYILKNVQHELINLAALHAAIQREHKTAWKLMVTSVRYKPTRIFRLRNFVILKKIFMGK
jgi:glycosyltransferase involved in cell wall biosynthesis